MSIFDTTRYQRTSGRIASFGVDGKKLVPDLRRLADEIEAGRVSVSLVETGSAAKQEDFVASTVKIAFSEPAAK